MHGAPAVEAALANRLNAAHLPGSPDRFTPGEVRELALEYLGDHDEELARLPDLAGQPHWNLWMSDGRPEAALFVVLLFSPGGVEFLCGRGVATEVRRFSESDFPDDPGAVPAALRERFTVAPGGLWLDRPTAEAWLGRGW